MNLPPVQCVSLFQHFLWPSDKGIKMDLLTLISVPCKPKVYDFLPWKTKRENSKNWVCQAFQALKRIKSTKVSQSSPYYLMPHKFSEVSTKFTFVFKKLLHLRHVRYNNMVLFFSKDGRIAKVDGFKLIFSYNIYLSLFFGTWCCWPLLSYKAKTCTKKPGHCTLFFTYCMYVFVQ